MGERKHAVEIYDGTMENHCRLPDGVWTLVLLVNEDWSWNLIPEAKSNVGTTSLGVLMAHCHIDLVQWITSPDFLIFFPTNWTFPHETPNHPRKSWRHQLRRPFVWSPQIDMVADAWDAGAPAVSCWGEAARELCRHLRVELCSAVVGVPKKLRFNRLQYVRVMVVSKFRIMRYGTLQTAVGSAISIHLSGLRDAQEMLVMVPGHRLGCHHAFTWFAVWQPGWGSRAPEYQSIKLKHNKFLSLRRYFSLRWYFGVESVFASCNCLQAFIKLMDVISFGRWVFYDHAS